MTIEATIPHYSTDECPTMKTKVGAYISMILSGHMTRDWQYVHLELPTIVTLALQIRFANLQAPGITTRNKKLLGGGHRYQVGGHLF